MAPSDEWYSAADLSIINSVVKEASAGRSVVAVYRGKSGVVKSFILGL